ncbi:MAG TPA: hypothetical protein VGC99_21765 [Candidatus Tectomicrobia bacterium]
MCAAKWLQLPCWGLMFLLGVFLAFGGTVLAEAPLSPSEQLRIDETDVAPESQPLTFSRLLDEYLATLQAILKHGTRSIQAYGLTEVKLTIRKDGSVTFSEIVVLDGPATLRNDLLPLVHQLGLLPPPPMDADVLDVSVLLPLGYPGSDLLDSIDQER